MTQPLPMTAGRILALVVGTPLALIVIGWTALTGVAWAAQGSYRVNLAIPAHGRTVTLAVDSGQLSLGPATGGRIRLTGTATYALVRSTVTWQSTSAGVAVHSGCRQPIAGPCSFDYAVSMPAGLGAAVSTGSGNVTVLGLTGHVTLQAGSGDVRASALSGAVEIKDQSGNITGTSLTGTQLTVQNESGDVNITGLASRDVTITNQSGNVTLTFAKVPGRVQVSNQSGDIKLVLPPGGTEYQVNASTSSGSQAIDVPRNSSSAHVITVTDQSGNITVTR
jgi:hypothetical protein